MLRHEKKRQGALVPFVAVLSVPLLAMMAFAVDSGYMCLSATELQNAADAAAMAAAQAMQPYFVQYYLPGQAYQSTVVSNGQSAAIAAAKKFASANTAGGGVAIQLLDSDITFGFQDSNGTYTSPYNAGFPNTVSVIARRDQTKNGQLKLFFGGVLGMGQVSLQASSRGTMYTGDASSLFVTAVGTPLSGVWTTGGTGTQSGAGGGGGTTSGGSQSAGLGALVLPIALDVNIWKSFYQTGKSPDGNFHAGPNTAWQLQVYPVPKQSPGNFSQVCVGPPSSDTPTFRQWIDYGMSVSDVQYQINNGLVPVSPSSPKQWVGSPGMNSTLVSNFADVIGKPNIIPLFQPVSTNPYQAGTSSGSNTTFAIVGFGSVIVSDVSGNGNNLNMSLQPSAIFNPDLVYSNVWPAGSQMSLSFGTPSTTFVAPKISY
jgi:hypothetical protein